MMTQEQQDAAWRSVPESIRREIRKGYNELKYYWHITADRRNGAMASYENIFGKHNLTTNKEEIQDKTMNKEELLKLRKEHGKQTLNIGDKVRVINASGKPLYDGKVATIIEKGMSCNEVYYGLYIEGVTVEKRSTPLIGKSEIIGNTSLLAPFFAEDLELMARRDIASTEEEWPRFSKGDRMRYVGEYQEFANKIWIIDGEVFYNDYHKCDMVSSLINGSAHLCNVPLSDLEPYIEEQEPKIGECVDSSSSLQNEISSLSKEDAEELAKCLAEVNNFIERNQASQVDWLAYRMELAKEVVNGLLFTGKSPETIVDETTTIVNGIVERLKGGENGKV